MTSRRKFLARMGSMMAAPTVLPLAGCGGQGESAAPASEADMAASAGSATPVGVQLYSVRNELDADVPGTLRAVREAGFDRVETYSLHDMSVADYRALLDDTGLTVGSMHAPYERVANDIGSVAAEAHALGSPWVAVAWIPHEGEFGASHIDQAIADFTAAGEALRSEGLRFAYHCHGYEFRPAEEGGTLFDRFLERTEPGGHLAFDRVMHHRSRTGSEIDFVGPGLGDLAIESKYVDGRWSGAAKTLHASRWTGIIATRTELNLDRPDLSAVPTAMLAWLLDT